jgi:sugar lactone lactonase YvrE
MNCRFRIFISIVIGVTLAGAPLPAQLIVQRVAGGGPNNIPALNTSLNNPRALALDHSGNLYIATAFQVFKVDTSGVLTLVAGGGLAGFGGDSGPATAASLANPLGIAVDGSGNIFIADQVNNRIRKVAAGTGIITTYAGNGYAGWSSDGVAATATGLYMPGAVALDSGGNLYIADTQDDRVRRVDAATGVITTYAGNGDYIFAGDSTSATNSAVPKPRGLAFDNSDNLYISDGSDVFEKSQERRSVFRRLQEEEG